jgi:hypothetical protein
MNATAEAIAMDGPLPADLVKWWQSFFANYPASPTRRMLDEDRVLAISHGIFCTDLFPLQRKNELSAMINLAWRIKPKVVMSIGCDKGGELYHWCRFIPTIERAIACEIRGTPYSAEFERAFPKIKFLWLPRSSLDPEVPHVVKGWLIDQKIDILFIDGDKSFFIDDFAFYRGLMSKAGIVFMHDITDPAPGEAYKRVQEHYKTFNLIDTSEALEMLGREPRNGHEGWLKYWNGRSCGVGCIFMPECSLVK